jgi:hypothetical protein
MVRRFEQRLRDAAPQPEAGDLLIRHLAVQQKKKINDYNIGDSKIIEGGSRDYKRI